MPDVSVSYELKNQWPVFQMFDNRNDYERMASAIKLNYDHKALRRSKTFR
jgi:hypothetical protein